MRNAILIGTSVLAACGEWVAYDGTPPPAVEFPAVGGMEHLGLSGLVMRYAGAAQSDQPVLLDYDRLTASPEAMFTLAQYRGSVAAVDPSELTTPDERLALWLNAYNASVIAGVLAQYGGDLSFRVTDSGTFFTDPIYQVGGESLSLDLIEHGVVRGDWDHPSVADASEQVRTWHAELWPSGSVDSRIHAALNCAAVSCPDLLAEQPFVYDAATLDQQLERQTVLWVNDSSRGAGPDGISRLFDWYSDDFVRSHGSVDAFISAFHFQTNYDVGAFLDYDWTLNAVGVVK